MLKMKENKKLIALIKEPPIINKTKPVNGGNKEIPTATPVNASKRPVMKELAATTPIMIDNKRINNKLLEARVFSRTND